PPPRRSPTGVPEQREGPRRTKAAGALRSVLVLVPLRSASRPSGYSRPAAYGTRATSGPLGADPLLQIPYSGPGQFFVKQHLADLLDLGLRQLQLRTAHPRFVVLRGNRFDAHAAALR